MAEVAPYYYRRRMVEKIRAVGAVSEETAKTSKDLGVDASTLRWLVFVRDVKKTDDGRFYIFTDKTR